MKIVQPPTHAIKNVQHLKPKYFAIKTQQSTQHT